MLILALQPKERSITSTALLIRSFGQEVPIQGRYLYGRVYFLLQFALIKFQRKKYSQGGLYQSMCLMKHMGENGIFFFPPQSHQNVGCFPFYLSNVCSATICVFYFSSPKTPREDKWILSCLLIVSRHKEMYKSAIKLLFLLLSICKGMHSFSIS